MYLYNTVSIKYASSPTKIHSCLHRKNTGKCGGTAPLIVISEYMQINFMVQVRRL